MKAPWARNEEAAFRRWSNDMGVTVSLNHKPHDLDQKPGAELLACILNEVIR